MKLAITSLCVAMIAALAAPAQAAEPQVIDIFEGMKNKQLDVKFVPKDIQGGRIIVKNNTDQPLTVRLPAAFATVPILAQIGGQGGGGAAGGGGGGGGGGGLFSIPPEKVRKIEASTVCLEHGKADPRPSMAYTIKPLEEFTDNAKVHELMHLFAKAGPRSRGAVQAAAWNLANDISWQKLADMKNKRLGRGPVPYFHRNDLIAGQKLAQMAIAAAKANEKSDSLSKR